jgi:serine phosphatase RsbU (regulator of sigma subunit)
MPSLPVSVYSGAKAVHRPWDLVPLFLYLFAGSLVFPRFYRFQPSLFSHAIMVSVVPSLAAQMHAAFRSTQLYDNDFNISLYLKIVANLVPMTGLILDYTRAYRNEVMLQLTEEKLRVARGVQLGLLPKNPPSIPGFDIAGISLPAEAVGGDYFDYLPMSDGCIGVVVADVSGHEIGGAILMAQTRAYLRALAQTRADIGGILARLNRFLLEDVQNKWFVTLFFARLNPKTHAFSYAAAGHASYLFHGDGSLETLIATTTPLGIDESDKILFAPEQPMEPGEILLLLTDGIPEAKSSAGKYFGIERVAEVIGQHRDRPARNIVDALFESLREFAGNGSFLDDVTAVVVKRTPVK